MHLLDAPAPSLRPLQILLVGEHDARLGHALERLPRVGLEAVQEASGPAEVTLVAVDAGLEPALALLAAEPDRVVIALVAHADPALESAAAQAGIADLLPLDELDEAVLGRAIRFALGRRPARSHGGGEGADVSERRAAEEELAAQHAFVTAVVDTAASLVLVLDREGRTTGFNTSCERLSGYTAAEVRGRRFWEVLLPEEQVAPVAAAYPRLLAGAFPHEHRNHWRTKDGRLRLIEWQTTALRDAAGAVTHVVATGIDVTERDAADRALRESEQRFQTMAARVPGMVYRATISRDGVPTFLYAGDGCRDLYGVEPEVLLADGHLVLRAIHPEDRAGFVRSIEESARTLSRWDWHGRVVAADGGIRHIHGTSQPERIAAGTTAWDGIMLDETGVHLARAREAEAQQTFHGAFEQAPIGMALVGLDGRFLQVNDALCAITGLPADALTGAPFSAITHPDDLKGSLDGLEAVVRGEVAVHRAEKRYRHADGHTVWVSVCATVIRDAAGTPLHMVSQVLDITDRKRFEQRLQHMADHDPLTGLMNRRRFEAALSDHVVQCERYGPHGSLLVLDVDDFKSVNDTLGHTAGDALIVAVAGVLRGRLRTADTLARLGGDEFAVLLPRADAAEAAEVAEELVAAVRERAAIPTDEHRHRVTISVGVRPFATGARVSAEDAIVHADLAMYEAKDAGRDGCSVFRPDERSRARTTSRLTWVRRVHEAIDQDSFVLQAQPILDLRADRVTKHELLVRMRGEDGALIPPGRFLPVAERFGIVARLDRWVVGQAVETLERTAAGADPPVLHVNISGRSLGDRQLLDAIRADLRNAPRVDPARLTFEVTETAAVADIQRACQFAAQLRELGCRFALDDFGSGFGSLYYLKHLPFDVLKIDGDFVKSCVGDRTDQLVIESAVLLARGLEKETIAEFVEDDAAMRLLRRLGVDHAQGYLVGRPSDLDDALDLTPAAGPAARSAG